jgi:hypothetical protein
MTVGMTLTAETGLGTRS